MKAKTTARIKALSEKKEPKGLVEEITINFVKMDKTVASTITVKPKDGKRFF